MKVSWIKTVFIFCMSVSALMGCGKETTTVKEADPISDVSEKTPEKAPGDVVAMVDDQAITEADLEAVQLDTVPSHRRESLRMKTIYYLVDTYIYAGEAKKKGFDQDPELQKEMEKIRREILARDFVAMHIEPNIEPTPEEIRAYYDENKDSQFVVPEGVLVQQIRTVQREDAEAAMRALEGGNSFEEAAEEWSKLVRKRDRKVAQRLYRNRIDPALEDAVFALEPGQISEVIPLQSENEYRVVKVLGKSAEEPVGFEDAKSPIRFRLMQRNKRKMMHDCYERAGVKQSPKEGILVQVGDEVFKEEAIAHILEQAKEGEEDKLKARWTQYFVDTTVFSNEALKAGLDSDPQVARKIYWKNLKLLADAYREKVVEKKIRITDADIAEEYKAHSEMFTTPLRFKAGLIVVETREKAEELRKKIEGGAPFSVLATQESMHESAKKGGAIDWFGQGEQEPVIEAAAKNLERFEVSDVLKLENGYGLIKLMAKQGGVRPMEDVAKDIRRVLHRKGLEEQREYYHDKWNVRILETDTTLTETPAPAEAPPDRLDETGSPGNPDDVPTPT